MPESMPNGSQRIELMVGPEESFLQLFRGHPFGVEHRVFPVVFRPVPIEDPAFAGIPFIQGGPGQGRQDVEIRQLHAIADEKIHRRFEHGFVIVIEPEHHARVYHDAVVVKHFDLVFEFSDLVEALVGFDQGMVGDRLHSHEDRDAATVGR